MSKAQGIAQSANQGQFKNRILNGSMQIDQRNNGSAVTINNAAYIYTLDRWAGYGKSSAGVFTVTRSSVAPNNFTNSALITVTTASTPSAGDLYGFRQGIEGFNFADFGWGTAAAQPATISFWVRSSLTGTFGAAVFSNDSNDAYPFTYTISAANTWEQKSVTIPARASGSWNTTNGNGLNVWFCIGGGTTTTANTWNTAGGGLITPTGATNIIATNGATWQITGVQLEKGSTATSFDYRPYGTELALCQRYCVSYGGSNLYEAVGYGFAISTGIVNINTATPVPMRAAPSLTTVGSWQISDGVTGSVIFVLSVVSVQMGVQQLSIQATSSGLTTYRPYRIETANSTVSRIFYTAEL